MLPRVIVRDVASVVAGDEGRGSAMSTAGSRHVASGTALCRASSRAMSRLSLRQVGVVIP